MLDQKNESVLKLTEMGAGLAEITMTNKLTSNKRGIAEKQEFHRTCEPTHETTKTETYSTP